MEGGHPDVGGGGLCDVRWAWTWRGHRSRNWIETGRDGMQMKVQVPSCTGAANVCMVEAINCEVRQVLF